ncbi:hypothetical protein [Actinokineospora enzanensis]|uniref:hypothetical protein n=1 Tax=Actinokineospora enzanensis TaxID=155975 RepID=UPI0003A96B38|nr:hypothetical protein [Actinokineospora enzanensis]
MSGQVDARGIVQAETIHGGVHYHAERAESSGEKPITGIFEVFAESERYVSADPTVFRAHGHFMRITVEAVPDRAVVLTGLRARVVSRRRSVTGYLGHLGPVSVRPFVVDLDAEEPLARPNHGVPDFPYTVTPHQPEVFEVKVVTTDREVRWRLELGWLCAGRAGSTLMDVAGEPFRSSL